MADFILVYIPKTFYIVIFLWIKCEFTAHGGQRCRLRNRIRFQSQIQIRSRSQNFLKSRIRIRSRIQIRSRIRKKSFRIHTLLEYQRNVFFNYKLSHRISKEFCKTLQATRESPSFRAYLDSSLVAGEVHCAGYAKVRQCKCWRLWLPACMRMTWLWPYFFKYNYKIENWMGHLLFWSFNVF
jgi:hypothetical protein